VSVRELKQIEAPLCDEQGVVDLEVHNRLREIAGLAPYEGETFPCTGAQHLRGFEARCTSSAHLSWSCSWQEPRRHHQESAFTQVCLREGCSRVDGATRGGAIHCHDCQEELQ
jgi:hypothetical protein